MNRVNFWLICNLIFAFFLPGGASALDIIGTGQNQAEAMNNALRNLSELVSGVHVTSRFRMDKRLAKGKVRTDVQDLFKSESEFYVENIQRYVTLLSEKRAVITLSKDNIAELREKYRLWKLRADVQGQVECKDNKIIVTLREINGVPVTVQSYQLIVNETKISWLCSAWRDKRRKEVAGMLAEPLTLADNRSASFEVALDDGFDILDLGKRSEIGVEKVFIRGVDYLGRKVEIKL